LQFQTTVPTWCPLPPEAALKNLEQPEQVALTSQKAAETDFNFR